MKQHTKWITTALAVAGGLLLANSAQAQYVSGDKYLDNIYIGGPSPIQPLSITGPNGIAITAPAGNGYLCLSAGLLYGGQYYRVCTGADATGGGSDWRTGESG